MTNAEAILEARRKHDAREFHRKIIRRIPADFGWDTAEMECGHNIEIPAHFQWSSHWSEWVCHKCRDAWIKQQTEDNNA